MHKMVLEMNILKYVKKKGSIKDNTALDLMQKN